MKRFFKTVTLNLSENGKYVVLLDHRPLHDLKTKRILEIPFEKLAKAVADEWSDLPDEFERTHTPLTIAVSGTLSLNKEEKEGIVQKIRQSLPCDVLCCLVPEPEKLKKTLEKTFLPVLEQINALAKTDFSLTENLSGQMPSERSLQYVQAYLSDVPDVKLAFLQKLSSTYGSFLLAFAVEKGILNAKEAFDVSIAEELYQNTFWPIDDEAKLVRKNRQKDAVFAGKILDLLKG